MTAPVCDVCSELEFLDGCPGCAYHKSKDDYARWAAAYDALASDARRQIASASRAVAVFRDAVLSHPNLASQIKATVPVPWAKLAAVAELHREP